MNRTVKILMLSDIFVGTGFGLIGPILSIFIKENLVGGTILAAGIASTIFLVVKSIVQLPFAKYVDAHDDRFKWMVAGTLLISLVPFIYIFAKTIFHIYIAQIIHGIGSALAFPTWLSIWNSHLDKNHESYEWSLYSTWVSVGVAVTASLGAGLAQYIGYDYTFVLVGLLSLVGCFVLFKLDKKDIAKPKEHLDIQYHKKRKLTSGTAPHGHH